MRTFIFISLLLLPILVQEIRGIGMVSARTPKAIEPAGNLKSANFNVKDLSLCKGNNRCNESGRIRKLVTKTTSTFSSSTPSKNDKNYQENGNAGPGSGQAGRSNNERIAGDKAENFSVHSSTMTSEQLEHDLEKYPDILDIAGMDYSPARRKPPIHN